MESRSLYWREGALWVLDQTALPAETSWLRLRDASEVAAAINRLAVRGAPALGAVGAYSVALSAFRHTSNGHTDTEAVRQDAARVIATRPTAVNLERGVRRGLAALAHGPEAVLAEADAAAEETRRANRAAASRAADIVEELCDDTPLRLLTHCNTGWLATFAVGTALGAVHELHRRGRVAEVLVDETRPLLQGSRLTAWELRQAGIPHRVCVDSAAAAAMRGGMVDCVLVGADRITRQGDVANKIGTYGLAVAAAHHGLPIVVVATEESIDEATGSDGDIVIEQRSGDELYRDPQFADPASRSDSFNPAFDVTPWQLITALVTEDRMVRNAVPHQ